MPWISGTSGLRPGPHGQGSLAEGCRFEKPSPKVCIAARFTRRLHDGGLRRLAPHVTAQRNRPPSAIMDVTDQIRGGLGCKRRTRLRGASANPTTAPGPLGSLENTVIPRQASEKTVTPGKRECRVVFRQHRDAARRRPVRSRQRSYARGKDQRRLAARRRRRQQALERCPHSSPGSLVPTGRPVRALRMWPPFQNPRLAGVHLVCK
jgi:hypothetical protein